MKRIKSLPIFAFLGILLLTLIISSILFSYKPVNHMENIVDFKLSVNDRDGGYYHTDRSKTDTASIFSVGDYLYISADMPAGYYKSPYLLINARYCGFTVSLDREEIFENKMQKALKAEFIPYRAVFVPLPSRDLEGHRLTITMLLTEDDVEFPIDYVLYGDYIDILKSFIQSKISILFGASFLCIFGVVFLLIALIFAARNYGFAAHIVSAAICLSFGLWLLEYQLLICLFYQQPFFDNLAYTLVFTLIPLCLVLLGLITGTLKRRRFVFAILFVIFYDLILVIGRYEGMTPQTVTTGVAALYIISSIFMLVIEARFVLSKRRTESIYVQLFGLASLNISLIITSIYYSGRLMSAKTISTSLDVALVVGASFFVVSRMLAYVFSLTDSVSAHQQEQTLSKLAYMDSLTGLPNRTTCDRVFMELDDSDLDYMIMSLDLNGLKVLNDSLGHAVGDRLIKDFADALNICFPDPAFRSRIGGDEFVVVMSEFPGESYLASRIDRLKKLLDEKSKDTGFDYSAAYGCCFRHELKNASSHDVYMKADERMYINKRMTHAVGY
ncbi:GGDEF domain-containing protein [Butyrivibrio sp. MC2013]|uniref:GGDEF domain-containing protein n=1 Tax=Butyrivibrio sp. MC2013 TaxID=1280686 RepID=UPI0003F7B323|nr:GGDEF domain-containing protein [Butyrivibrio sp. MC2013]